MPRQSWEGVPKYDILLWMWQAMRTKECYAFKPLISKTNLFSSCYLLRVLRGSYKNICISIIKYIISALLVMQKLETIITLVITTLKLTIETWSWTIVKTGLKGSFCPCIVFTCRKVRRMVSHVY